MSDHRETLVIDVAAHLEVLLQGYRSIVCLVQLCTQPASQEREVWQSGTHTDYLNALRKRPAERLINTFGRGA